MGKNAQDFADQIIDTLRFSPRPERSRLRDMIQSSCVFRVAVALVGMEVFLDALLDDQNASKAPSRILMEMVEAW